MALFSTISTILLSTGWHIDFERPCVSTNPTHFFPSPGDPGFPIDTILSKLAEKKSIDGHFGVIVAKKEKDHGRILQRFCLVRP